MICFTTHTFRNTHEALVATHVFRRLRFDGEILFGDDLRKIFKAFDVP